LGDENVRIPIQNDYDFTNLSAVKIHWQLMEDDRELSGGDANLTHIPHAAAWLELPLTSLKQLHAGASYYALFAFTRADGSEIGRRSVELIPNPSGFPVAPPSELTLSVDKGKETVVHAGSIAYRFDPATARLVSASLDGHELIHAATLSIWRPLNIMEKAVLFPRGSATKELPDLNNSRVTVRNWKVEQSRGEVHLNAIAEYVVNTANSFSVDYTYDVHYDGSLTVQYAVDPKLEARFLPLIEINLPVSPQLSQVRWLGLGPIDTYPNERAAGNFGVWSAASGSKDASGVKATRWIEMGSPHGEGGVVRIENCPYAQFEGGTL
jgi:beta-galactosidase